MISLLIASASLLIDIINIPYDNGANIIGSRDAYKSLKKDLDFLPIYSEKIINPNQHLRSIFGKGFYEISNSLDRNHFPLTIGGDHSVAIPSIFASNEHCLYNKKKLGVLWFDAHADFNTMLTSESYNIHGMPVSILCGHDLYMLSYGNSLLSNQFAYYGLRDIDSLEFIRFQEHNMLLLDSEKELNEWINNFDYIHLSFDMDCFDPDDFKGVNTQVKNGPSLENINIMLDNIKNSNKLISMDLVEYNPRIENNTTTIINILEKLFS
jgi:arginase